MPLLLLSLFTQAAHTKFIITITAKWTIIFVNARIETRPIILLNPQCTHRYPQVSFEKQNTVENTNGSSRIQRYFHLRHTVAAGQEFWIRFVSIRVNFDFHKINEYLNCVPCKTPPETRFAGATCSICICKRTSVSVSAFVYHRTGLAGCPPTQTYLQIYRLGDNCESHSDLAHKKLFLYWLHSKFFGISVSFLVFGRVGRGFVQIGWPPPLRSAHEWASITINKHLHS